MIADAWEWILHMTHISVIATWYPWWVGLWAIVAGTLHIRYMIRKKRRHAVRLGWADDAVGTRMMDLSGLCATVGIMPILLSLYQDCYHAEPELTTKLVKLVFLLPALLWVMLALLHESRKS